MGSDDDRQFDEHGNPYITDAAGDKHFAPRPSNQLIVHREDWNLLEKIRGLAEKMCDQPWDSDEESEAHNELIKAIEQINALRSEKRALPTVQLAAYEHEVEERPNGSQ